MTVEAATSPSASDLELAIERLREAQRRGIDWLLGAIGPDGAPPPDDRNGWYRVPWTLAFVGEREVAARVMSWVEREALTPAGDLVPGAAQQPFVSAWATYPLSILAQGAWTLERYDTAARLMRTLRDYQAPDTGGAYMERPEARSTRRQCLFPTAQLGLAALMTGHRDVADGAYRWFRALLAAQPELPDRLYTAWEPAGLVTDVPEEDDDAFVVVTDFRRPRQAFYNPGIGAAFLARYFMATGEPTARELMRSLLALSAGGCEEQYDYRESSQICKFGWGSALALEVDPGGDHLRHVVRMAHWYADAQHPDGRWYPSSFRVPNPTLGDALVKTAEHVLWVAMMLTSLAGAQRRGPVARG